MDIIDRTPQRDATKQELQQYETVSEQIQQLDTSKTFDSTDPNQRLFFVSFDGTRNDRDGDELGNIHTNPDLLEDMVPQGLDNIESRYIPGVATRNDNWVEEASESYSGDGSIDRAERAYEELKVLVKQWHDENPNVEIHVSTAGFSRGTGSQRHFANLVHERGIPDPNGDGYLIPPSGVYQDIMLMYDSVVTGKEDVLRLGIPPSVANAVHLTADHENRTSFDSASIVDHFNPDDTGILEAGLPGSHSDIGGNWDYGGLSARSLELGHELLKLMGVPVNDIPEEYGIDDDNILIHDSGILDFDSLKDALFSIGNWEFGDREILSPGNPGRRSEAQQQQAELAEQQRILDEIAAVKQAAAEREAELDLMGSEIALRDAINSGDGLDIAREGAGYLSSLDNRNDVFLNDNNPATEDGFLEQSGEAILSGIEHGIGLGQAIDDGDGWEIAGNSIDLLRDIERYLDANGGGFFDVEGAGSGATALTIASSGLALAEAIEDGDGWGIASSASSLLNGIDQYSSDINIGGEALGGVASAIGLAANIASFDDVLESGDALNIAYTTASTVNNAIGVYNAIVGSTNAIASNIPIISIIAIGTQLAMGDVRGAAVTALTTAALCIPVYGWAVAAVIQIVNLVAGGDDPPSATADFVLDENGNVVMDVHGDSELRGSVEAAGSLLVSIIQSYKDMGGRVLIDGSLPSLFMESGEDPQIRYTSEYGGNVVVSVGNSAKLPIEMRGALYARDRGDRVDDAIKLARDGQGNIDFTKVDAALAAMGFSKQGMTYTYGESWTPRVGVTYGNGVFTGGGNANGPQGQHFVATNGDIKSLPLTPNQRPSQTIGKLLSAVSLQHNFAGASGLLLPLKVTWQTGMAPTNSKVRSPRTVTVFPQSLTRQTCRRSSLRSSPALAAPSIPLQIRAAYPVSPLQRHPHYPPLPIPISLSGGRNYPQAIFTSTFIPTRNPLTHSPQTTS